MPEPLSLTEAEFEREKNVVKQEIWQRTRSNPDTIHYEEFEAKFYEDTIFAHFRVGQEKAVEAITLEIAEGWYKTHYEESSMLVSIHGELDVSKTKKLAKAIFPNDRFTILVTDTRSTLVADPELEGFGPLTKPASFSPERNVAFTMERISDVQTAPTLQWSRLYSGDADWQSHLAHKDVLSALIGSRLKEGLHLTLVDQEQLVSDWSVSIGWATNGYWEVELWATLEEGVLPQTVKSIFDDYFNNLANGGISQSSIDRLQRRMLKNYKRKTEQPEKLIWFITEWAIFHGYDAAMRWPVDLAAVTKSEVEGFMKLFKNPLREGTLIINPRDN